VWIDIEPGSLLTWIVRVKPKHPVLILSNEYDPITPIENGVETLRNSFLKGDAGLGIRAGYGVKFFVFFPISPR
jgi:hypothetical protein